jgi:uncharacterized protein (TIGR01244 family)
MSNFSFSKEVSIQEKESKAPNYVEKLFNIGNVYIGGQPSQSDVELLQKEGFSHVINTRTPGEMEGLDFHEDFLLKKASINYKFIPIGGEEHAYSPEKLEEFAQAMDSAKDGKILLHCRSGHRASQLWAAYLVKYKDMKPDDALELVSALNWWPIPMEKLLGKKLSVTVIEE